MFIVNFEQLDYLFKSFFFWLALNKQHWAVVNGLESLERMTIIIVISCDATQLFVEELVQANNKETINAMSLCSLVIY